MTKHCYIDFDLIKQIPNKYNLRPQDIKRLIIKDWEYLKLRTWQNKAMTNGTWWCHCEGSNPPGKKYADETEFWISFREEDNKVDCRFYSCGGMCSYNFFNFYKVDEIENKCDMQMQVNTIRWLNEMIDQGILAIE